MPRVLFLTYHGTGHFNACFKIARALQREYEVIFAGVEFFKKYVASQGFEYYSLRTVPFGLGFEAWVNTTEKKKNIYWHVLKDRWTNRLYKLRESDLHELIRKTHTDFLLIDSWQSTDFITLYPLLKNEKIKVAFIQTMMPTRVEKDIPPLNSLALPNNASAVKKSQLVFSGKKLLRSWKQKINYFGKSNSVMVNGKLIENKIPLRYRSDKQTLFSYSFDHVDEFILTPEGFDFVSAHRNSWHHYIGFMVEEHRITPPDLSYREAEATIRKKLSQNDDLIYCSFGSLQHDDLGNVRKFLVRLMEVCHKRHHLLVIAVNDDGLCNSFTGLGDNIFVFRSVPQLEILDLAKVFITHGGLNSIRESICKGVPMLVYPIDPDTDHNGNSSRVIVHQLGLRGDLVKDSVTDIARKIERLITDNVFREKIGVMKRIDQSYTEENFLNQLKNIKSIE